MIPGGLAAHLERVVHERRHSRVLEAPLVAPRVGVMLHYDDSSRDDWAVAWFSDPLCRNGYTWLVLDDGRVVELADPAKRTPHAGRCRTPNANSAFYGISAATNGLVVATEAQVQAIAELIAALARAHRWAIPLVVGHDSEALPAGRKVDPRGLRRDGVPILDVEDVRGRVTRLLCGEVR